MAAVPWPSDRFNPLLKIDAREGERMQASMFNVRVPLEQIGQGSDVFLMNTFTDAQVIVSRDVADLLDRVGADTEGFTDEQREALATLTEHE